MPSSGLHLYQRLHDPRVKVGGCVVHGSILPICGKAKRSITPFIACSAGGVVWYGQLKLCFTACYLEEVMELCYVRWLGRSQDVARAAQRSLTPAETRGPFASFRWNLHPGGGRFVGHPSLGSPHYGIVDVRSVMYVAPLLTSLADPIDAVDPTFRLNTDMWNTY